METRILDEYKELNIRVYEGTLLIKNVIRIVVIGVTNEDMRTDETIKNMIIPKRYMSAETVMQQLLVEYGGKHINKCNRNARGVINIDGKKNMKEVMEWLDSMLVMLKMIKY